MVAQELVGDSAFLYRACVNMFLEVTPFPIKRWSTSFLLKFLPLYFYYFF